MYIESFFLRTYIVNLLEVEQNNSYKIVNIIVKYGNNHRNCHHHINHCLYGPRKPPQDHHDEHSYAKELEIGCQVPGLLHTLKRETLRYNYYTGST